MDKVFLLAQTSAPCYCCIESVLGIYSSLETAVDAKQLQEETLEDNEGRMILIINLDEYKKGGW